MKEPSVVDAADDAPPRRARVIDIGMVLTTPNSDRLLITDIVGLRVKLVRVPDTCSPSDYGKTFRAKPTSDDPTAASLD